MNRVLFISTREMYIVTEKLRSAEFVERKGFEIRIYAENEEEGLGNLTLSSVDEAKWFMKHIFVNLGNNKNLIMDYTDETVTEITATEAENIIVQPEPYIPHAPQSKIDTITNSAIQHIRLKDE